MHRTHGAHSGVSHSARWTNGEDRAATWVERGPRAGSRGGSSGLGPWTPSPPRPRRPQHLPGPPLPTATPSDATRPVSDLTSWHRSLGRPEGPHHAPETRISNGVNRASGFRGRPRRYRLPRNASDFRHIRNRRSSALGRTAGRFRVPRGDDPQTRRSGSPHDEKAQVRCPLRLVPKSPRTPHATSSGSRGFPLMEKVQVSGPSSSVGRPPPRSQRQTSVTIHASYRPL